MPKISVVIPTANRPWLVSMAAKTALLSANVELEVIVSDNSSAQNYVEENKRELSAEISDGSIRYVRPPRTLSPPEHFEFALSFAGGDLVAYLTDKMLLRTETLYQAEQAFLSSGAQILNWDYRIFDPQVEPYLGPRATSEESRKTSPCHISIYDPLEALWFKANCVPDRTLQTNRDFARGKIVYGLYTMELIRAIRSKSGTLFGGATHDYAAMVQALSLANLGAEISCIGIDFLGLKPEESLGSLTSYSGEGVRLYYESFRDTKQIVENLMVPNLFASQHNMVAHDYMKFLPIYGLEFFFNRRGWIEAIKKDLSMPSRTWENEEQEVQQTNLFSEFVLVESKKQRKSHFSLLNKCALGKKLHFRLVRFFVSMRRVALFSKPTTSTEPRAKP